MSHSKVVSLIESKTEYSFQGVVWSSNFEFKAIFFCSFLSSKSRKSIWRFFSITKAGKNGFSFFEKGIKMFWIEWKMIDVLRWTFHGLPPHATQLRFISVFLFVYHGDKANIIPPNNWDFLSICVSFYVFHQVVDARACMHTWLFSYSILDILFMLLKHELKFWNCKKRLKMRKVFTKLEKAIFKSKCSAAKNVSQFQQRRVFIHS